jgi:penicillin-insensitive murein endopeptidase
MTNRTAAPVPRALVLLGLASLLLAGCWYAPSPLTPGIGGSVGLPHRGVLTGGEQLSVRGDGFRTFRDDDSRWGTPRLVSVIRRASAEVERARPGGAPLVVADLSLRHGGFHVRHRSHRSGRDVDLLFYVTTPDGRSVVNPGFVGFGHDGLAKADAGGRRFVRLDMPRQWLLVRALLTDQDAHVQWLFVARWLEALLIEYAQARGEDPELIWRAELVLRQPSDSLTHDDHIHMRLACSPAEAVAGCEWTGPRWPWLPQAPTRTPLSDEELLVALLEE